MATGKKRKPDLRRIRTSKTYTLPEIAKALDRNIATVRSWVRKGLPLLSDQKPVLVVGSELKDWLQSNHRARQQKCLPDELYCCTCRWPRKPVAGTAQIIPRNQKTVSVTGRCIICNTRMIQTRSLKKLPELEILFNTQTPQMQRLSGCSNASDKRTFESYEGKMEGACKSILHSNTCTGGKE